jgi:hypothetical protein
MRPPLGRRRGRPGADRRAQVRSGRACAAADGGAIPVFAAAPRFRAPVCVIAGLDRRCAQCHGAVDGCEMVCTVDGETVWLHRDR